MVPGGKWYETAAKGKDKEEIAEVFQLTLQEIQQMKERIAKLIVDTTVLLDKIANVRQLVTKVSEFRCAC